MIVCGSVDTGTPDLPTLFSSAFLSAVINGIWISINNLLGHRRALESARRNRLGDAYVRWATAVRSAVEANNSCMLNSVLVSWEEMEGDARLAERSKSVDERMSTERRALRDAHHALMLTEADARSRSRVKAITDLATVIPADQPGLDHTTDLRLVAKRVMDKNGPRGDQAVADLDAFVAELAASDRIF